MYDIRETNVTVTLVSHTPINDVIVELVQPLQKVELLLDLIELRLFRVRQAEEVFADSVGAVLPPQGVEVVLEHLQAVRSLSWGQAWLHRTVLVVLVDKLTTIHLK